MAIKDLYKEVEKEKENEVDDSSIIMDREEYISEHKHLIKVLRSGDKKTQEAEAKKQEEELASEVGEMDDEDEDD